MTQTITAVRSAVEKLDQPRATSQVPTILLATTDRWYPTARLAIALAKAGCVLDAVCPSGHPFVLTKAVRHFYPYNGLSPVASFARAIRETNPDVVIPGDDLASWHLHELYAREKQRRTERNSICELIERSLGAAESFSVVRSRNAFMDLAREEGVRVPLTEVIRDKNDLLNWITNAGFPTVLKANGTSGGDGVKVVNTVEEAESSFRKLHSPPLLARAAKRAVVDQDLTLVWPSVFRRRPVVNAQSFVAGREATSAIVCWQGAVLASVHFEVVQKMRLTGHATVIRRIEHPEMTFAAEKIARRLKLSGFHGLDFMIEAGTGNAYLIEINPRTTQIGHLAFGPGHDLPAALYAAITGQQIAAGCKITDRDTIALFPQEWKRDPESSFLTSAYHDVPWSEPQMVSACISKVQKQRSQNSSKSFQKMPVSPAPLIRPAADSQAAAWIAEQE